MYHLPVSTQPRRLHDVVVRSNHYHFVNIMSELTMDDMSSQPLWLLYFKVQMLTLFYLFRCLANIVLGIVRGKMVLMGRAREKSVLEVVVTKSKEW